MRRKRTQGLTVIDRIKAKREEIVQEMKRS